MGLPAEFALDLAGVDRIAPIVPRAIGDEGNQIGMGTMSRGRQATVESRTQCAHQIQIGARRAASDQIGFANPARFDHPLDGRAMVGHMEPIANLAAITVDR